MRNHQSVALADTLRDSGLINDFARQLKAIETSKSRLMGELVELIEVLDETERGSWRSIVVAAGEAGVTDEDMHRELGSSPSTIYRWRYDNVAPRGGTRKLMKGALLRLIKERRAQLTSDSLEAA